MHNMIIEDERNVNADIENWREAPIPEVETVVDETTRFQQFLAQHRQIKDKEAHLALRNVLIEHLWEQYRHLIPLCMNAHDHNFMQKFLAFGRHLASYHQMDVQTVAAASLRYRSKHGCCHEAQRRRNHENSLSLWCLSLYSMKN
ncbi:hypothetical protein ACOSQ2_025481 [Xanthoceras sorbifolium]